MRRSTGEQVKKCKVCWQEKTLDLFYPDKRNADGRRTTCIECWKVVTKKAAKIRQSKPNHEERLKKYAHLPKHCLACGEEKMPPLFYDSKSARDGKRPICITCWKHKHYRMPEKNKAFRAKHLDRIRSEDRERIKSIEARQKKKEYDLTWRGRDKERRRDVLLKRNYGITLEQYNSMFEKQGGACFICKKPQSELKKTLAVDHCHRSGKVRSLLCAPCNKGLGCFKDNPALIKIAAAYLETAIQNG